MLTCIPIPGPFRSGNPIERFNGEIKRRAGVVGIFPDDDAIVRLVAVLLLETNDEWAVQRARYMTPESVGRLSDDPLISLPAVARWSARPCRRAATNAASYTTIGDTIPMNATDAVPILVGSCRAPLAPGNCRPFLT